MTIKEAEKRTGLTRSNIRFYEKEKLIVPPRNDSNGYRDYTEKDIENLKKIAYLRTLEISIEDIQRIISGKVSLTEIIEKQAELIGEQIENLSRAKVMCERMLESGNVSYEELQIEKYMTDPQTYWKDNKAVFKLDSVSFLYLWGDFITWFAITGICFLIGILSYARLPDVIPVQWSGGAAVSSVDKIFIFAYPLACILLRVFARPVIYTRLLMDRSYGEPVTEYLTNYLCFIALSVELFSVLYAFGLAKSVVVVLAADTAVFLGMLVAAMVRMKRVSASKSKYLH